VPDPVALSGSVNADFNNSTPGSGVAACGLGGLANSFLGGVLKGALVTAVIIGGIALMPAEAAIATTVGLAALGAIGAARLASAWKDMTANQKAEAAGEVAGGFLVGGVAGFARGAAGRSAGLANKVTTATNLADESAESTAVANPPPSPRSGGPASTGGMDFTRSQLQHAYKHADDFGVTGNANNAKLAEFQTAIEAHVRAPGTMAIPGTYRGLPVTHFVDPNTGLNVIRNAAGNFLSGWKLNPPQLQNVLGRGKL
jgi:Colicin D